MFRMDTGQRYLSYYTDGVIRNNSPNILLFYRTSDIGDFQSVPVLSERQFNGWGKYIQITSGSAAKLVGTLELDLVKASVAATGAL